jgi:hypothetical protein
MVDPLTLYSIYSFGIHNEINSGIGPLGITQSTLDLYSRYIQHLAIRRPGGSFGKDGDMYVMTEYTQEKIDAVVQHYRQIQDWAVNNCTLIPAIGEVDIDLRFSKLVDTMDICFIDTIIAANGSNRLLLCDDMHLRILGKQILGCEGVWLQPVMSVCLREKTLTKQKYAETIAEMIVSNMHFVSIDAPMLITLAQLDQWSVTERFRKSLETLGLPDTDIRSAVSVLRDFFIEFQNHEESLDNMDLFVYAALNGIRAWKSIELIKIITSIGYLFKEREYKHKFADSITQWCKGHLFPFPND